MYQELFLCLILNLVIQNQAITLWNELHKIKPCPSPQKYTVDTLALPLGPEMWVYDIEKFEALKQGRNNFNTIPSIRAHLFTGKKLLLGIMGSVVAYCVCADFWWPEYTFHPHGLAKDIAPSRMQRCTELGCSRTDCRWKPKLVA